MYCVNIIHNIFTRKKNILYFYNITFFERYIGFDEIMR